MHRPIVELTVTVPGLAELVERGTLDLHDANQIVDDAKEEVTKALRPFDGMGGLANARNDYLILTHRPWNTVAQG